MSLLPWFGLVVSGCPKSSGQQLRRTWTATGPHGHLLHTPFAGHHPRQVLAKSWELQQVLKTAPKASSDAAHRLSLPSKPRLKHPGDSCSFARHTAAELSKQRARREQRRREEQQYQAAAQEALQGYQRAKAQVRSAHDRRVAVAKRLSQEAPPLPAGRDRRL